MGSEKKKKAVLQEKLELLRAATKSHAVNKASIIADATKYITELKHKVEESEQQLAQDSKFPMVTVIPQEKGFLINVFSQQSGAELLVSVLEAFDDIGLEVLDANISCTGTFQLEAVGCERQENVDAQMVRQVLSEAIKKFMETKD